MKKSLARPDEEKPCEKSPVKKSPMREKRPKTATMARAGR